MSSAVTTQVTELQNYINGAWSRPSSTEFFDVTNPATTEILARTPMSSPADVDAAVQAAADAFPAWRRTPPGERVQYLFKLKNLLEEHLDELSRLITLENGKTFAEAKAELRRGIENVEVACGIPMMMQGYNLEDVTPGVDEMQIRQPLGVVAAIVPFNFPAMISYWFLPYAIACGNTFVLKPSERVPLSMIRAFELIEKTGLPKGVVNLVNGGKDVVNALCDHPQVRAISFVGSTPVAKHVYARSAASGKRMQCQGGAKKSFRDSIAHSASNLRVGNGLEPGIQMGPVISGNSKKRIESLISAGVGEGAKAILDGRNTKIPNHESGSFLTPTVLDGLPATSQLANTEIFGPVLSLIHANSMDEGMDFLRRRPYGNQASLFTTSGSAARRFRY